MIVKIAPLGERVVEVNVEPNTTIDDALNIAGIVLNGRSIQLNGQPAELSQTIPDGSSNIITLAQKMKAGR